jgi:microcin C transport system substrate-binding protein
MSQMMRAALSIFALTISSGAMASGWGPATHGFATYHTLKYPADFAHFDYVNPEAPKGGRITVGAQGTFDSFNPFNIKGAPAALVGLIYDTLLTSSRDEDFSSYGRLAESLQLADDWSGMRVNLRPDARWHDGKALTAEDVVWTFETFTTKGRPFFRHYWKDVTKVTAITRHQVEFSFAPGGSRELPSILGQMPVLPKHYWQDRDFTKSTLEPPLGSGPFRISKFEPGRYVEVQRVSDYWGRDIAVNKGRFNFDQIRADYYRDGAVILEAFKAGKIDYRVENSARRWATAYDFPARQDGLVEATAFPNQGPIGMQGFVFNMRRPLFQDRKVRQALGYAFDFEWSNKTLFFGQYARTTGYFQGRPWGSSDIPKGRELEILEGFRDKLPADVFSRPFTLPVTDGSGNNRRQLRQALKLLREAGWTVTDGTLRNAAGTAFRFEILLQSGSTMDKIALPMTKNLERLGITATIRQVDTAQYQNRTRDFDFDMVVGGFGPVLPPGNEQREYWHSSAADMPGSGNLAGLKNPVVDALVAGVINAPSWDELLAWSQALDRVLQWQYVVIPQFHNDVDRIAFWDRFGRPRKIPTHGVSLRGNWWIDPARDARIQAARGQ